MSCWLKAQGHIDLKVKSCFGNYLSREECPECSNRCYCRSVSEEEKKKVLLEGEKV